MSRASGMIIFLLLSFSWNVFSTPKGKHTEVTFDKALPEDISNENFPDRIDSFDFPNANLLDLVKAIGKLTGINFIVDPSLKGKQVSIIAPSAITVAEAYKAFLSALSANGYTVIRSGAFWKIQSTEKSLKDNTEVYSGDYFPNTDQLITRIIKLKYINAKDFETSIKWLLSQNNQISTLESSNSIILSDYGSVIERIMKIVYEMDVPGSEEGIEIINIEHAAADELANTLTNLLSISYNSRRSYAPSSKRVKSLSPSVQKSSSIGKIKISRIIPDLRINSIVVSANKKGMKRIKELVKKLDTPADLSRTGGVYVYNVLYGTAEEVYNTLMGIKPSPPPSRTSSPRSPFSPVHRNIPGRSYSSMRSSKSPLFLNVKIMADANTNSLIISAKNKYDYKKVLAVLKKIDVPRDQVFIQAIIVEMVVDKKNNREINLAGALTSLFKDKFNNLPYFKDLGDSLLGSSVAGFLSQSFNINSLQKAQLGPGFVLGLPLLDFIRKLTNESIDSQSYTVDELNRLDIEPNQRQALVQRLANSDNQFNQTLKGSFIPLFRLLKTASNVNVLSIPQVTTLDNVPALIEAGENAPVGLTSTTTTGLTSQNSVDRRDITLKLNIVPRINQESNTVQMDIKQKFDDFSNRSSSASELASRGVHIIKRNIETKMVLNDGETAVLGGLLTDKEVHNETKVPLLGDIPILGWMFKGSTVTKEKRNLVIFITPTIIKGREQKQKAKQILGEKLEERIHFIKKYMKGRDPHGQILKDLIPESQLIRKKQKKNKGFWPGDFSKTEAVDELDHSTKKDEESDQESFFDVREREDVQDEDLIFETQTEGGENLRPEDYQEAIRQDFQNTEELEKEDGQNSEREETTPIAEEFLREEKEKPDKNKLDQGDNSEKEELFDPIDPKDLGF